MTLTKFTWCLLLFAAPAFSQDHQKIVTFDAPNTGNPGTVTAPSGINARGEVIGQVLDNKGIQHAFLRSAKGEFTIFDVANVADGGETFPLAINNSGVIVGFAYEPNADPVPVSHGFIRTPDGKITIVDYPGAGPEGTALASINNRGAAAGTFSGTDHQSHGLIRQPDGSFTTFDDIPSGGATGVSSINDSGTVVGINYDGYSESSLNGFVRRTDGDFVNFNCPVGAIGNAYMDNSGEVEGICFTEPMMDNTPYERAPDGTITTWKNPVENQPLAATDVSAENERGAVVGSFTVGPPFVYVSFIHYLDGRFVTLDLPPNFPSNLGALATGINARGEVTGFWLDLEHNMNHGYLWTPKKDGEGGDDECKCDDDQ
jgi:hypothetical protein